ncbi:MAG: 3-phosphoshikimate 1-carboxyvinyltransferase [Deltaproteobacteria bacterium]|nr:3-phosphoshikimate 1-carboxyvinyltransferase [Deltaproteobacteria bacterium]
MSTTQQGPRSLLPGGVPGGTVVVPGDKSLSHRSLIFGALAPGDYTLHGMSDGADVHATASAIEALGVPVTRGSAETPWTVGEGDLEEPADVIDCGNSGTSMRLLTGLVAGHSFLSVLTGDVSLRRRPMGRIAGPLRAMGASVDGRDGGRLAPLVVRGGSLSGIEHRSPVPSAQVKSCLLLAGLQAQGDVVVREEHRSRDHTERMLPAFGVEVEILDDGVAMRGGQSLVAPANRTLAVPADISAAAFFAVLAGIRPGAELTLPAVGTNPTRDGLLEALDAAGVGLTRTNERLVAGEPVADLVVGGGDLVAFEVGGALVPRLIDEIPVLAVLAARCPGVSRFCDAADLRAKESDRITQVVRLLTALGVRVDERPDGFDVHGQPDGSFAVQGAIDAAHDHRIAMAAAVAATCADGPVTLTGADSVDSSFPGFFSTLERCLVR